MKDTALYGHLHGLKAPWSFKNAALFCANQRVVVEVVLKKDWVWANASDATTKAHINGWSERSGATLYLCQFETIIKASTAQLKFSDGTVDELTVPQEQPHSQVTTLMAAFVIKLLEACPTIKTVCTLIRPREGARKRPTDQSQP